MNVNFFGFKILNNTILTILFIFIIGLSAIPSVAAKSNVIKKDIEEDFYQLILTQNTLLKSSLLNEIRESWKSEYVPLAIETMIYSGDAMVTNTLISILEEKTSEKFGRDIQAWYSWMWNKKEEISPGYGNFKADLYKNIDAKFERYFKDRQNLARIRLDEIRWGGVRQDGIPPLRNPKMIPAAKANYLHKDNIIFGIEINGDARAYPKRILAWHEMFVDEIGGVDIAGVYCTLCGTVIPYKTQLNGEIYELGTSGFLYRSNKLMYDKKTQSLWNTLKGEPVVGPLVDKGIKLEHLSIVTTTWGEWLRRHPNTQVLSEQTGFSRDYGEGVAYQEYFGTDELMFHTPFQDTRLKNKQEILALRFNASPKEQLAIDIDFLSKHPVFTEKIGRQKLLIVTDNSGANRVYDPKNIEIVDYDGDSELIDVNGQKWHLSEARLISESGETLERLPSHRAFWFGWHATFPNTRLIK